MSKDKALALAAKVLDREIQRLAVEANLYERYHARNPSAVNAFKKREELREAKKVLMTLAADLD